jgi:transposase
VDKTISATKAMHVILDNYAAQKHPKAIAWLSRHPRVTFRYTPTSASWLIAVDCFFAALTKRRLRRGVFLGVVDLEAAINRYLAEHNTDPKPFRWNAYPAKFIAAAARGDQTLESIQEPLPRAA